MVSITILVIMLIDILLKFWVNPAEYVQSPWEVLDLVVVSLSLIIDVLVIPMIDNPEHKSETELLMVALIVVRFWRVIRIAHGFFEVVGGEIERVKVLTDRIQSLKAQMKENGIVVPD